MTGDLISREDVLSALKGVIARTGLYGVSVEVILANVPVVEAEPVVHAHWIEDDPCCRRYCSACGFVVDDDASNFLYGNYQIKPKRCPECGAHMDEEVTE